MKKELKARLEGIIFNSTDLTLAEKDYLTKRDYSSRIIKALDNYLNIKHSDDSTEAMLRDAKRALDEVITEYENENCNSGYDLSTIHVFREIDFLYTVGDVLKNEFYYRKNAAEYKRFLERIKNRISRDRTEIQKYKNNLNMKGYVQYLRSAIKTDKIVLKYYEEIILKQLENDN